MPFESPFYWVACVIGNVLLWGYLIHNFRRRLPVDGEITEKDSIIYEEHFASGHSLRDVVTRFMGARNCLEVVVTTDALYICVLFPFSPISTLFDLEHYVMKSRITSLERAQFLFGEGVTIEYMRPDGTRSRFWLRPQSLDRLYSAVTSPPDSLRAAS